jgi:hypothetical protein
MPRRMTVQCPNCRQPINAVVETLIDVARDPEAKNRLLSGRTNTIQCPNCGTPVTVAAPILYHDASKQLLISYVPMELNLSKDGQEKAVGELMRELTGALPKEAIKGYMFQPRGALTMQGLIDQILQADGVSPEMMEEQRARARLIETFLRADDDQLPALVAQHDDKIDGQFLQLMTLMGQRMLQEGQREAAEQIAMTQQALVQLSTFGQQLMQASQAQEEIVRQVAADVQGLGQNATRSDFLDLALRYGAQEDGDEWLQALVGLVRPAFDNQFFQELTVRTGQAPAAERDALESVRDRVQQLASMVDQQTQMAVQEAAGFLQALLTSANPDELLQSNTDMVDDTFMAVLTANIQEAERQGNANAANRLKDVYQRVVNLLRSSMQPELRLINELLSMPTDDEAREMLTQQAGQYGQGLLDMMDAVEDILVSRGEAGALERLAFLREEAQQIIK